MPNASRQCSTKPPASRIPETERAAPFGLKRHVGDRRFESLAASAHPENLSQTTATSLGFDSGEPALDDWLRRWARAHTNEGRIVPHLRGLFKSGSWGGMPLRSRRPPLRIQAHPDVKRNMRSIPVMVLGRLAVDKDFSKVAESAQRTLYATAVLRAVQPRDRWYSCHPGPCLIRCSESGSISATVCASPIGR